MEIIVSTCDKKYPSENEILCVFMGLKRLNLFDRQISEPVLTTSHLNLPVSLSFKELIILSSASKNP